MAILDSGTSFAGSTWRAKCSVMIICDRPPLDGEFGIQSSASKCVMSMMYPLKAEADYNIAGQGNALMPGVQILVKEGKHYIATLSESNFRQEVLAGGYLHSAKPQR